MPKPQVVDYASVGNQPMWRSWLAFWTLIAAAGLAVGALCAMQAVSHYIGASEARGIFCDNCYGAAIGRLGIHSEHATTLGLLAAGVALLGTVKAVRHVNDMRWLRLQAKPAAPCRRASDLLDD